MTTATAKPRAVMVLSGPMTGLPDYNRPAFRAVAAHLRASGYDVVSPAEYEIQPTATWGECMGICLDAMRELQEQRLAGEVAPIIAVLPGADRSPGAAVEAALASYWGWARCDVPPRWCEGETAEGYTPDHPRWETVQGDMFDRSHRADLEAGRRKGD